jgi:hypothetical protein
MKAGTSEGTQIVRSKDNAVLVFQAKDTGSHDFGVLGVLHGRCLSGQRRWVEGRFDGLHWVDVGEEGRRHLGFCGGGGGGDDEVNSKADAASELGRVSKGKSEEGELP